MDATFQVELPAEPASADLPASALGKFIEEHRGKDVVVLDLRELNIWTDYFVIATVSSHTHMQGLHRQIREFIRSLGADTLGGHRRISGEDEWDLLDLGNIVIHLMTEKARAFYELERLWGNGTVIFRGS
jgi:ribosome-associated protein